MVSFVGCNLFMFVSSSQRQTDEHFPMIQYAAAFGWNRALNERKKRAEKIRYFDGIRSTFTTCSIFCDIKIISNISSNGQFYFHIQIISLCTIFMSCWFCSIDVWWAERVCVCVFVSFIVVCVVFNWKLNK